MINISFSSNRTTATGTGNRDIVMETMASSDGRINVEKKVLTYQESTSNATWEKNLYKKYMRYFRPIHQRNSAKTRIFFEKNEDCTLEGGGDF